MNKNTYFIIVETVLVLSFFDVMQVTLWTSLLYLANSFFFQFPTKKTFYTLAVYLVFVQKITIMAIYFVLIADNIFSK